MRMSLKAQYAICGMFDLAYNGEGRPVQVRVVGERQRIPARYLEQIFQRLRRARLVRGKRGPGGGYVLARHPSEITLQDILEALEGPVAPRIAAGPPPRDRAPAERPAFLWPALGDRIADTLSDFDLERLCNEAAAGGVPRAHEDTRMWHI